MGILGDLLPVWMAHGMNRRRNHISRRRIDFVHGGNQTDHLILCGGEDAVRNNRNERVLTLSGEMKIDTFCTAIEDAQARKQPVLCLYPAADAPDLPLDDIRFAQTPVIFGVNATYAPLLVLEESVTEADLYAFFDRVARDYFGKDNTSDLYCVRNTMQMLLNLLSALGADYLTMENLSILANDLFELDGRQFMRQVAHRTGQEFPNRWRDYLILEWDGAKTKFHAFWNTFTQCLQKYTVNGSDRRESLYSVLSQPGAVCLCQLDFSDHFLKSVLLSELELIAGSIGKIKLVDYRVPLPLDGKHPFLAELDSCLLGDSFRKLGIERMVYPNPTIVCFGVNAADAADILESLVAVGRWIRTSGGYGFRPGHLDIHFSGAEIRPLTENDLSIRQIREGSALRIDGNGYTFIDNLFV